MYFLARAFARAKKSTLHLSVPTYLTYINSKIIESKKNYSALKIFFYQHFSKKFKKVMIFRSKNLAAKFKRP